MSLCIHILAQTPVIGLRNELGVIKVGKYAVKNIKADTDNLTGFTLYKAADVVLSANELNTIFDLQDADAGVKLNFSPDIKGTSLKNPFNEQKFIAKPLGYV